MAESIDYNERGVKKLLSIDAVTEEAMRFYPWPDDGEPVEVVIDEAELLDPQAIHREATDRRLSTRPKY